MLFIVFKFDVYSGQHQRMAHRYEVPGLFCARYPGYLRYGEHVAFFHLAVPDLFEGLFFHGYLSMCQSLSFCYILVADFDHTASSLNIHMCKFHFSLLSCSCLCLLCDFQKDNAFRACSLWQRLLSFPDPHFFLWLT